MKIGIQPSAIAAVCFSDFGVIEAMWIGMCSR